MPKFVGPQESWTVWEDRNDLQIQRNIGRRAVRFEAFRIRISDAYQFELRSRRLVDAGLWVEYNIELLFRANLFWSYFEVLRMSKEWLADGLIGRIRWQARLWYSSLDCHYRRDINNIINGEPYSNFEFSSRRLGFDACLSSTAFVVFSTSVRHSQITRFPNLD